MRSESRTPKAHPRSQMQNQKQKVFEHLVFCPIPISSCPHCPKLESRKASARRLQRTADYGPLIFAWKKLKATIRRVAHNNIFIRLLSPMFPVPFTERLRKNIWDKAAGTQQLGPNFWDTITVTNFWGKISSMKISEIASLGLENIWQKLKGKFSGKTP